MDAGSVLQDSGTVWRERKSTAQGLFALVAFYIFPSVLWALMNLVPVWPLDGGHIMRSIVQLRGGNMIQALWISVIAAGLMAAYGFANGQQYMGYLIFGAWCRQIFRRCNRVADRITDTIVWLKPTRDALQNAKFLT